jgi:hypothetical protein
MHGEDRREAQSGSAQATNVLQVTKVRLAGPPFPVAERHAGIPGRLRRAAAELDHIPIAALVG